MSVPDPIRIAMWSGPRNISTAMMRSFEARGDCAVVDEPFYAAYLSQTGIDHPLRNQVIASQSCDWREVAAQMLGAVPDRKPIWYQKHMTLHLLQDFGRDWMSRVCNAFLIRTPEAVLASYARKREDVSLADVGFVQQRELFLQVAERQGCPPPVVDSDDVLRDPANTLALLCSALGVRYSDAMLVWSAGRRTTDGVWAPAWYQAVEQSTGFVAPGGMSGARLPPHLQKLADLARPHYEALARYRLGAAGRSGI